jgi:adenylosuccinate synthase
MSSLVVIGAQWGDEGKGKLVDYLTSKAGWVVRFQGGNNAGHTLVVDGVKTKLSLMPSGVLREKTKCLIAAGVVVDPQVLLKEISDLSQRGISIGREKLVIDRDAHLVFGYHRAIDQAREENKGSDKIGTTGRGIGPAYEDRAQRTGIRFADLFDIPGLKKKLEERVSHANKYLKYVLNSNNQVTFDNEWTTLEPCISKLTEFVGNGSLLISSALKHEERVLFEGAQGTLLDQVFGTVPFVTSSHTLAGSVCIGCGLGPKQIGHVLGVAKAYTTRVGSGPFPTELDGEIADQIRQKGAEFGTVTGRPRRCGWFDAVAMQKAVRINGIDSIALTKLDVLSGLEKIKICIKYMLDGQELSDMPSLASELSRVEPEYIELPGWDESIERATKWHQMPVEARFYLSTVSEILGCPITIASVGPERSSTIFSNSAAYVRNFME